MKKTLKKTPNNEFLFKVCFNDNKEFLVSKSRILKKDIFDYRLEENIIGKSFKQNCGSICKVIRKTNKKEKITENFLYEIKFLREYSSTRFATKYAILRKSVVNYALPWKSSNALFKYIRKNFNEKPTIAQLELRLYEKFKEYSIKGIGKLIKLFGLREEISYWEGREEISLKNFIKENILNLRIKTYEDLKYEIDIYIPNSKLGFEYNGTYWHNLYEQKNPGYHQKKFNYFLKKGILIFNIWDYMWFKDSKHIIIRKETENFIQEIIKQFTIPKLSYLTK